MSRHVAVLMGGWSAEREVSLVSGATVSNALKDGGYQVTPIDVQRDLGALLTRWFPRPDVIFNALHGRYGEDGCIQGLLNIIDVPYTHSGVLASSLAMNKPIANKMLSAVGINVPENKVLNREDFVAGNLMDPPFVIKPPNEGSSVGVHIVLEGDNYLPIDEAWCFGSQVMVERFIPGQELTVAVMGGVALGVTEISTDHDFYDYDAKYEDGQSTHQIPAQVPPEVYDEAQRISVLAHETLNCRGVSRADIRYDGKDLYLLELNTQPGMTPTSLVPEQAAFANITFTDLVAWLVENAACDD